MKIRYPFERNIRTIQNFSELGRFFKETEKDIHDLKKIRKWFYIAIKAVK